MTIGLHLEPDLLQQHKSEAKQYQYSATLLLLSTYSALDHTEDLPSFYGDKDTSQKTSYCTAQRMGRGRNDSWMNTGDHRLLDSLDTDSYRTLVHCEFVHPLRLIHQETKSTRRRMFLNSFFKNTYHILKINNMINFIMSYAVSYLHDT